MPAPPFVGQHDEDAPAIHVAGASLHQAVPGKAVDQARQRALAQVDGIGQVLGARFALGDLRQPVEDLEVADAESVPLGIFRSGALVRANIGAITLFGTYVSFQFLITQYLQVLAGWSAMATALAFACLVAAYAVFLRAGYGVAPPASAARRRVDDVGGAAQRHAYPLPRSHLPHLLRQFGEQFAHRRQVRYPRLAVRGRHSPGLGALGSETCLVSKVADDLVAQPRGLDQADILADLGGDRRIGAGTWLRFLRHRNHLLSGFALGTGRAERRRNMPLSISPAPAMLAPPARVK
jgi:hypothetical protein